MVKTLIFLLCCFVVPLAFAGTDKIDGDTLKFLLAPAESEHARHRNDLNADEMHLLIQKKQGQLLKKKDQKNAVKTPELEVGRPDSSSAPEDEDKKKGPGNGQNGEGGWPEDINKANSATPEPDEERAGSSKNKSSDKQKPKKKKYRRVPPNWGTTGTNTVLPVKVYSDEVKTTSGPLFGIRMGTEIRAKLVRATTNVEPGATEFITTSDCFGDYKNLPVGTKIFLNKAVATGSNRLYFGSASGLNAITPEGKEFTIMCSVTDITINKQLGLVGAITTDEKIIQRSLAAGTFAAGKSVVNSLSGNVAAEVAGAVADTALGEKEAQSDASLREATFVILVSPQDVYIRVDKSF